MCFNDGYKYPTPESIAVSIETTGLDSECDEILKIVIMCASSKNVIFDSFIQPQIHKSWEEAEEVNHIQPSMVCSAPYISDVLPEIATILVNAKEIICYNSEFCLSFLENSGCIIPRNTKISDVMKIFAMYKGDYNQYYERVNMKKLY